MAEGRNSPHEPFETCLQNRLGKDMSPVWYGQCDLVRQERAVFEWNKCSCPILRPSIEQRELKWMHGHFWEQCILEMLHEIHSVQSLQVSLLV